MCGDKKETTGIAFPRKNQFVNLQSADNCQYFSACEIHTSKLKIYFCSDHGEALCSDCVVEHKNQNCNTEPIENKIKEVKKTADDIFSDQRFENVSECLCIVDDTDMMLDLFYLKMKKKIIDCKERIARELGVSIQDQELIRHIYDDVQRADQIVSHNIFTHNTLDELLSIKNSCGSVMYNLKLSEQAEALPTFVATISKDFEHLLEYDGDPLKLSLADWSVQHSSSCVEDEGTQPYKPSDNSDLQGAVLWETDNNDSDGLKEYDNSFDDSDDNDDPDDTKEEEEVTEDIEDVTANENHDSLTIYDASLPNQDLAEQPKLQSNRPHRKDGGLLKSIDYRRKIEYSSELSSYETLTNKSISNRDSDSATSISKSTSDGIKYATSLFKVKTASDTLSKPYVDTVTNYRRSISESNVAATSSFHGISPTFSESNTPRKITSDSTTKKNLYLYRSSSTDVSHSSVKGKPQGEIRSETETPNVPKLTPSSESSITAVNTNRVSQPGTQSPSGHSITPTTERSQHNEVRERTSLISVAPGMEIRSQLPQIKEDFSVEQCVGIVISDRFILTSNEKRLQKRRFEDSKLIEDTELSNMTSLCLVPSSGEISVLQTNKSIRVYSPAVSKWHFKADISLPYQCICCWKVDRLDSWKTYVFVVSYTNDIHQDCINMVTINHDCSFPKSNKECECITPKDSVLLTSETFPSIRGVNSLGAMSRDQQLLISAIDGLVCVKVSGGENAEISWTCPFRTNISQIACDDNYVYVCVPNEKRVAKVSKNGEIITANILPTEIAADRIAVKENTVLVGSFFHHDWTCKVYRITF
ncbi:hypothetical protein ACJMK2_037680 [Sinanodonta woodiana]|uniref:B box-type domain-containing protein n=1 Tax=Sinanodonta woodiana TaxID=1069815 RepID=A0ABD3WQF6_SINWO